MLEIAPGSCVWIGFFQSTTRYKYTETIKYPTVCPIYLIKWPFFGWSKKYIIVNKNPPILLYKLEYISYQSPRGLSPKFSLILKIPGFKLRRFHFYFIKGPFFPIFNFETWYFQNQWKFWTQTSWRLKPNIFKHI